MHVSTQCFPSLLAKDIVTKLSQMYVITLILLTLYQPYFKVYGVFKWYGSMEWVKGVEMTAQQNTK